MKVIISQDGQRVFTCGECQVFDIAVIECPGKKKDIYSVGLGNISIGQFRSKERALKVLKNIAAFLVNSEKIFYVPQNGGRKGDENDTGRN